jgi:hypothetical protein
MIFFGFPDGTSLNKMEIQYDKSVRLFYPVMMVMMMVINSRRDLQDVFYTDHFRSPGVQTSI